MRLLLLILLALPASAAVIPYVSPRIADSTDILRTRPPILNEVIRTLRFSTNFTQGDGSGADYIYVAGSTETNLPNIAVTNGAYHIINWDGHVSKFGAVGDGVTEDLPAIQAALTVAPTMSGGVVQFQAGKIYKVTGGIICTNDNLRFFGNGAWFLLNANKTSGMASLRTMPGGGISPYGPYQQVWATNQVFQDFTIVAGDLDGPEDNPQKNLFYVIGSEGVRVSNVQIFGNEESSWSMSIDSSNGRYDNIYIINQGDIYHDGFHIAGGTNIVANNIISYSGDDSFPVGSDSDRVIRDVVVTGFYGESSHGFPIKIYASNFLGPGGVYPTSRVERVTFSSGMVKSGYYRNAGLSVQDIGWRMGSTNFTNLVPPRLITDVTFRDIQLETRWPEGGTPKTTSVHDISIYGGERVNFFNVDTPTPYYSAVLFASAKDVLFKDCYLGAPHVAERATMQWLVTSFGVITHTNINITFDNCDIYGRPDVAVAWNLPFNTAGLTFRNTRFYSAPDSISSALYLSGSLTDVTLDTCHFIGGGTNAFTLVSPSGRFVVNDLIVENTFTNRYNGTNNNAFRRVTTAEGLEEVRLNGLYYERNTNGIIISKALYTTNHPVGFGRPGNANLILENSSQTALLRLQRSSTNATSQGYAEWTLLGNRSHWTSPGGFTFVNTSTTTDTNRIAHFSVADFALSSLPVSWLYVRADGGTNNSLSWGGGTASGIAAHSHTFYRTHPDNTNNGVPALIISAPSNLTNNTPETTLRISYGTNTTTYRVYLTNVAGVDGAVLYIPGLSIP